MAVLNRGPLLSATRADWIVIAAIWFLLVIRCLLVGDWALSVDELFSFRLIHDPSLSHMLAALGDRADGAPPEFYLLARGWSALFSESPMSLRMFSAIGFCAGFTLLWLTIRRAAGFIPAALACAVFLAHGNNIDFESLQVRFYGLLFALVSLATVLGIRLCQSDHPSRGLLAANLLTNAALVLCHPLGGFYGAAIMAGVLLSDLLAKPFRIRPLVIASYVLGWSALFLWFSQLLRQAGINYPHGWVPVPRWVQFLGDFGLSGSFILLLLALFALMFALADRRSPAPPSNWRDLVGARYEYLLVGLGLTGIGPLFWTLSRLVPSNSIFLPRYLIGSTIGWTILAAIALTYLLGRRPIRWPMASNLLIFAFVLLALDRFWLLPAKRLLGLPVQDPNAYLSGISDRAFGHADLPIVCPRGEDYLSREHYAPDAARYYFLVDWQAALDPRARPQAVVEFNIFSAIERHYHTGHIMNASEFLRTHPVFLLHDYPPAHWPELYLKSGNYRITHLTPDSSLAYDHEGELPLLLVEKQP